ncbi:MAG TPA: histidine kinase [Bryobacteraceae bacterium]|nr:histidine kinase [Bryobacteraceae bacterium]
MPDWLSVHEPTLVNTIGHCGGAVIFGMLLYFFLVNWRRGHDERARLPVLAAGLAFLWNIGSLIALGTGPRGGRASDIIVAASFSVLSLLPAVLLHISLESQHRPIWIGGYGVSCSAIVLHIADLVTGRPSFHFAALLVVTLGFAALTIVSVVVELRQKNRAATSRLVGAMVLFLFAISFAHFGAEHGHQAWSKEIALHHAGIPLALFVLLQNYRFLLLDAFLRFVVNATLAAAAALATIRIVESADYGALRTHPFDAGLLFAGACLLLTLFVYVRNRVQSWLTSVVFLRSNVDEALEQLVRLVRASPDESVYLPAAAEVIAGFVRATRFELRDRARQGEAEQAVVPLRFSRGDARYLLLGPREGGRRYLSEDLAALLRLGAAVVEHVEQLRGIQMQGLVTQAELKALQAQINPHFFFNALNTLYGTIDRGNAEARRLVLNLSDVFRYLLRSDRTLIEIEEELRIVRAYLEIEQLRLGSKLRTEIDVDAAALHAAIPMLSVQPLVENAVKHGVAARAGAGFVRLNITAERHALSIRVSNSGECDAELLNGAQDAAGVGLANVRRRLQLCYGEESSFLAEVEDGVTTVGFFLPLKAMTA